ncbi:hypothetical protein NPIL_144371 [Nephila pilipes]|uniref:Uncharacterized protein n=1 Tax=Nephila pilipes TaxID=299642 RepID=A0A8X6P913_NEPPI|nr:hypothetical protein NPIL_144371 [Nephila pilipes]
MTSSTDLTKVRSVEPKYVKAPLTYLGYQATHNDVIVLRILITVAIEAETRMAFSIGGCTLGSVTDTYLAEETTRHSATTLPWRHSGQQRV